MFILLKIVTIAILVSLAEAKKANCPNGDRKDSFIEEVEEVGHLSVNCSYVAQKNNLLCTRDDVKKDCCDTCAPQKGCKDLPINIRFYEQDFHNCFDFTNRFPQKCARFSNYCCASCKKLKDSRPDAPATCKYGEPNAPFMPLASGKISCKALVAMSSYHCTKRYVRENCCDTCDPQNGCKDRPFEIRYEEQKFSNCPDLVNKYPKFCHPISIFCCASCQTVIDIPGK